MCNGSQACPTDILLLYIWIYKYNKKQTKVPVTRARGDILAVVTFSDENSRVLSWGGPPLYRN